MYHYQSESAHRHLNTEAVKSTGRNWYALYTRPRSEKKVSEELKRLDVESYVPIYKVLRFWSDRKKYIEEPLFPSYVFIFANSEERCRSLHPYGAIRLVSFNGKPALITDEQIQTVRRIARDGLNPRMHTSFSQGDRVEIISGPLSGLTGYLTQIRGQARFVVNIDSIRQSITVEIDPSCLKRLSFIN